MKYCAECWEKFEGKTICPQCGAKLYDCDDWDKYSVECGLLKRCYGSKVPYGVRAIGSACMGYGAEVTDIVLPNTVKYIADRAFYHTYFKTATIPSSVTHIGYEAFNGCDKLTGVTLLGIKYIGKSAFSCCRELASVTIGSGVVSIGEYAFSGCYKLNTIKFAGTKAQWAKVKKGYDWKASTPLQAVVCSDGKVV